MQVTLPSEGNSVLEPHLQKQTQLEQTIDSELINILDCDLDSAIDLLPVADELQEDQVCVRLLNRYPNTYAAKQS